jgi:hypothetical protein
MSEIGPSRQKAEAKLKALARDEFKMPTTAELLLLHSAATGEETSCGLNEDRDHPSNDPQLSEADGRAWPKDRNIRGAMIRWLVTDEEAKKLLDPSGPNMLGARVIGALNLSAVKVPVPLALKRCHIMEPATLRPAS